MNEPTTLAAPASRLDQHAFAYRLNGLALPGSASGGRPITEPIWTMAQLTEVEREFLNCRYDSLLAKHVGAGDSPVGQRARLYARVLATYGVACPHPTDWRQYFRSSAFECLACEDLISDCLHPRGVVAGPGGAW